MSTQRSGTQTLQGKTTGIHGMLVFGDDVPRFSHFPMFQPPHHSQVILEVGFDGATKGVLDADRKAESDNIFSFKPEVFDITELDPSGPGPVRTSLRGTLYHGHFEHGGEPISEEITVRISRVVYFQLLDLEAAHDNNADLRYLVLGRAGDFHLAHYITARPDFDHVLQARLVPGSIKNDEGDPVPDETAAQFNLGDPAYFQGRHDVPAERLTAPGTFKALFSGQPSRAGVVTYTADLEIVQEIYLEVAELA
ncbi:hypothetical protein [Actinomadura rugatobispora]|uniref:Uncharacterized protein n=1 Tax=Actinomadura rugatobispora TaxID=1994 RepID=A0ABW1A8C0_9ACTN|nr:hypothetical protein GCM10010200_018370 [Actinomadura rugatobispora]